MTDTQTSDSNSTDFETDKAPRKSPYNINGPRTAEPEDFDEKDDTESEE